MMQELVLKEVVDMLHNTYSDASIGVSGSMAMRTHKRNSDVDILFQQDNIRQSFLLSFSHRGVKVSLFHFNKEMLYCNERKYLFTYHNMPITYISDTSIIYDSKGLIADLKGFVDSIVNRRILLKHIFIDELKNEITYLLQSDLDGIMNEKRRLYGVVNRIISIFYLSLYADKIVEKIEGHNPFHTIKKDDSTLYKKLRECLPYTANSYGQIKWLFENHILTNYK